MPAAGRRHAGNRHVSVANGLDFLEPVAGYDFVKSTEILVKQPYQRDRLHPFGQECEALDVSEQDCRRWRVFRLHLAIFLKFLGDQPGIGEQFLGPRLLGGQIGMSLIKSFMV